MLSPYTSPHLPLSPTYLELLGLGEDLVGLLLGGGDEVQHLRHLRVLVHLAWVWSGCWVRVRVRDRVQCEPLKHRHAAAVAVGPHPLAPHPLALTRRSALALALLVRPRGAAPSTRRWSRSSTRRVCPSTRREAAPRSVRGGGSAELAAALSIHRGGPRLRHQCGRAEQRLLGGVVLRLGELRARRHLIRVRVRVRVRVGVGFRVRVKG